MNTSPGAVLFGIVLIAIGLAIDRDANGITTRWTERLGDQRRLMGFESKWYRPDSVAWAKSAGKVLMFLGLVFVLGGIAG